MKQIITILLLCLVATTMSAKSRITRSYHKESLSKVLEDLNAASNSQTIYFIYDELEDFTVTCSFKRLSLDDAVRTVIGFYPMAVTRKGSRIFVECVQKSDHRLKGKLIDEQGHPVPFANIILYHPADSAMIGGGVSNEAGDFVIPCAASGRVRARISSIGFKTIERIVPVTQVGTIRMQTKDYHLHNVTISGMGPVIRHEVGRLQYIVANDPFAKGQNAIELMGRVPMVTMAGSHASILGKGQAGFMLNGRMLPDDETIRQRLWTMPSENIERIEVVSTPSGRYQTDAGNGYINIVTKRDKSTGWRGNLNGQFVSSDDWSGRLGGTLSYASKKVDISIGADGGRETAASDRMLKFADSYVRIPSSRTETLNKDLRMNAILRYQPHHRLELGSFVAYQAQQPSTTIDNVLTFDNYEILSRTTQRHNGNHSVSLTAYSDWKMDDKGRLLSLTYNYYNKVDGHTSKLSGESRDISTEDAFQKIESLLGESSLRYKIHSLKLDLSLPFKSVQVDAGVGYTMIDNESSERVQVTDIRCEYTSDRIILEDSSFIPTPSHDKPRMGSDLHKERITSAYLSAMKRWKGFTAKAGLRYEHARYDRENRSSTIFIEYYPMGEVYLFAAPYKKDYGFHQSTDRLLPSASLRYQTTLGHQWEIQWGMSILRPNFYDLNPSRTFTSPIDYSAGSPLLMPSYTNNIELGYHHRKGLSVVAYFHHGSDQVEWYSSFRTSIYARSIYPENCYSSDRTGISLSYQVRPVSQLNVQAESDLNYYNAWLLPGFDHYNPRLPSYFSYPDLYGWGGRFRLSADVFLNRQRTLMFSAHYNQWIKQHVGLRRYDSYSRFYFALRYSMLNDRLKLSLVADDPFHQHVTDAESYYTNRIERNHVNHHSHSIGLTVSYSLGEKTARRAYRDLKNTETKRAEKRWDVNNR